MKEPTRRRGYYFRDVHNYPSVTKISKSVGDPAGLIHWNVVQGAEALVLEIMKNPQLFAKAKEFERKNGNKAYSTQALMGWAREIALAGAQSELKRTGDFGTMAHKMIENHILGNGQEFEDAPERALTALETYKRFEDDIKPKYLYLEQEIINVQDKYGGRLDCVLELSEDSLDKLKPYLKNNSDIPNSGAIIVDVKTGSFMRDSHARQLGAYTVGMDVDLGVEIHGGMVIHIERDNPEDLTVEFYDSISLTKGYNGFMACHRAWELNLSPQWYKKENNI